jgi:hypothetical protein
VVSGVYDSVLEASRILKVEVELAVLGVVGGFGAGADVRLELVEAVGDDLAGCQCQGSYGTSKEGVLTD